MLECSWHRNGERIRPRVPECHTRASRLLLTELGSAEPRARGFPAGPASLLAALRPPQALNKAVSLPKSVCLGGCGYFPQEQESKPGGCFLGPHPSPRIALFQQRQRGGRISSRKISSLYPSSTLSELAGGAGTAHPFHRTQSPERRTQFSSSQQKPGGPACRTQALRHPSLRLPTTNHGKKYT